MLDDRDHARQVSVMSAMDALNHRYGKRTLHFGDPGKVRGRRPSWMTRRHDEPALHNGVGRAGQGALMCNRYTPARGDDPVFDRLGRNTVSYPPGAVFAKIGHSASAASCG